MLLHMWQICDVS
jgi:hypothetical protein